MANAMMRSVFFISVKIVIGHAISVYRGINVDEIQIVPSEYTDIEYKKLNEFLKSQIQKFCLQWTTNDDSEFRSQRQECSIVETDGPVVIKIEPRIEKITGFRVVDRENKKIEVDKLNIKYLFQ